MLKFARTHTKIAAAIVLRTFRPDAEIEIREFALRQLNDFKVLRLLVFLDEIPKRFHWKVTTRHDRQVGVHRAERGVSGECPNA